MLLLVHLERHLKCIDELIFDVFTYCYMYLLSIESSRQSKHRKETL